jgi:nicotinate-nucleotide adenylyltransferase
LRLGVMGGTFDPIHHGHLVTAEEAVHQFDLDRAMFIPSARPPHKKGVRSSSPADRLRMVELAIEGNERLAASTLEIERTGLSYTVDTLRELHRQYGSDAMLFFITGADAILEILTWKEPENVLSESVFIAATRPGYPLQKLQDALPALNSRGEPAMASIRVMEVPALAISSTDIRERVRSGRPFRYMVPEAVWSYICEKGLYK